MRQFLALFYRLDFLNYVSKKKKKFSSQKTREKTRRDKEIQEYGKLLSLRPSVCHKDKTKYTRKSKHGREDLSDTSE